EEAYTLARTASNDAALLDRAVLVSELAVARYLLHGVRAEEATVVADAAQMLRTLADQVADEPPIGQQEPVAAAAAGRADGPAHEVGAADGGPEEHESIEEAEPAGSASERTGSVRLDPPPGTAEVESVGFAPAEGTDTPRNHAWDAQGTEEVALPWELRESDERRASDHLSAEPGDEDPPRR
ncbi:hypothetical protein PU560_04980, partial [Georgenia sp. 10Sc9-8]|nr:hypothetical protein [Georgenia halotolerans]